jgi:hypothetical protein
LPLTAFKALRAGINRRPYDVMLEEIFPFYKNRLSAAKPSFDILRFVILRFFGSLFPGSAVRF